MNILSLRGGGIRGVATAAFLAEYEGAVGSPCHEHFDLIAGTSTGAIIAVGLGLGLAASDILQFYFDRASTIFQKRFGHKIGLVSSRYDSTELLSELNIAFSYAWLKSTKTRVMVSTTRMNDLSARFWKSWRHDILAGHAAASSAAAPVYFDPVPIKDVDDAGKQYVDGRADHSLYSDRSGSIGHYADGGLHSNNPALVALAEAKDIKRRSQNHTEAKGVSILDVACPEPKIKPPLRPGVLGFGPEIVETFMTAGQDATEEILRRELGGDYQIVRPPLDCASPALDDVSESNLLELEEIGRRQFWVEAERGLFGEAIRLKGEEQSIYETIAEEDAA